MSYVVMLRTDAAGRCPVLMHEGDELLAEPGVRWQWVAQTDDYDEAIWLMGTMHSTVPDRPGQ